MTSINPYSPGAGTRPPVLAGRDDQIALAASIASRVEAGRETTPLIYTGLHGMGKTSLLHRTRDELRQRGWLAGYYEGRRDVEPGVAISAIVTESRPLVGEKLRKALDRIGDLKVNFGLTNFGIEVGTKDPAAPPHDPYLELVALLRKLGESVRESGVGVALIIDELQVFRKRDLAVLIQALSSLQEEPIVLIGAGLPYLPSEMSKANTYAERFRFEPVDRLLDFDIRLAIVEPAAAAGSAWTDAAIDDVIRLSYGYPYFVQLYASETWEAAGSATTIAPEHVQAALPRVRRQLDAGLYSARYNRLSESEREYVDAMARLMDPREKEDLFDLGLAARERVGSGQIAAKLGKSLSALSPVRDRVIRKGLIHSPDHGQLEFSVPGFADYVRRRITIGEV